MSNPILPPEDREQLVEDLTPVVRAATRHRAPLHRQLGVWLTLLGVVVAAAAYAVLWVHSSANAHDAVVARSQAAEANGVARALASQVRQLGGVPVGTPSGVVGPRGSRGPGPSDAQVQANVRAVCSATPGLCQQPVSLARLQHAVSACFAANACPAPKRGRRGPSGASGASGATGATGAQGPAPSADQIADGWLTYCSAHNGCAGPAGPKGDTGAQGAKGDQGDQGPAGTGIASIDCTGLGIDQLTVHLTDGTTQTVPCNATTTPSGAPS